MVRYPNTSRTRLVDVANDAGYTALHYAAWAGSVASIRALVSFEANLTPKNLAAVSGLRIGTAQEAHMAASCWCSAWSRHHASLQR